jgi:hypothetical protein
VSHLTEDDLVLHYYRDPECRGRVEAHLARCAACAAAYRELAAALDLVPEIECPERNERYGLEVWQRIRPHLPDRGAVGAFASIGWRVPALAASAVLTMSLAMWSWDRVSGPAPVSGPIVESVPRAADRDSVIESRRVLLLSVADHLERSDRVLTDIMNAPAGVDISVEQGWAEDLLWTGRIYRQNALDVNEQSVAAVLDDLERTLLDIVHSPPQLTDADLAAVRERVDSGALLFKVRVMRDDLTEADVPAARIGRGGVEVS